MDDESKLQGTCTRVERQFYVAEARDSSQLLKYMRFIKGDEFNGMTPDGARTHYQTVSSEAKRKRP
jgi:hypothetical protein